MQFEIIVYINNNMNAFDEAISDNTVDLDKISEIVSVGKVTLNDALNWAGKKGYLEVVKYLISEGAENLNQALIWTSRGGNNLETIEYLISKGANNLNNALGQAAMGGNLDNIKFLVNQGANDLNDALLWASLNGHLNIVKFLVNQGANDFDEALHWASLGLHIEVMGFLIENGANLDKLKCKKYIKIAIQLKKENDELMQQLYMPGGKEFDKASERFYSNQKILNEMKLNIMKLDSKWGKSAIN